MEGAWLRTLYLTPHLSTPLQCTDNSHKAPPFPNPLLICKDRSLTLYFYFLYTFSQCYVAAGKLDQYSPLTIFFKHSLMDRCYLQQQEEIQTISLSDSVCKSWRKLEGGWNRGGECNCVCLTRLIRSSLCESQSKSGCSFTRGRIFKEKCAIGSAWPGVDLRFCPLWMRSSIAVRASDCQCRSRNNPGFDPSILRHSGIWGATDAAELNTVHRGKKSKQNPPVCLSIASIDQILNREVWPELFSERNNSLLIHNMQSYNYGFFIEKRREKNWVSQDNILLSR